VATPPPEEDELATLWQEVLESLRYQTVQSAFDAWLKPSRLIAIKGNQVTIAVHNEAARQWLTHRLFIVIQRVMKQCLGWAVILNFVIAAESSETRQSSELLQLAG
jgi:chromosomal replication initiation ATPase DnaA